MGKLTLSKVGSCLVSILVILSANAHAQQVAILDTGVDPDAGYNIVPGFNYFTNSEDTSDVSDREGEGHGTVSVRLVSESFSGGIVPFVVTDGAPIGIESVDTARIARDSALSDILGRSQVRVVGITWGREGIAGSSASLIPELSNANKVIAIIAGNNSAVQPNPLATSSFNLSGVIIVGGTDADGVLLPFSNQAGTTANKYVAAIGLPSLDAVGDGGSSWATARISGIAGAVLQQNPNLSAADVVDVILQSAEDRGDVGTDSVYGRGFIRNAQQVLNNVIGPAVVPTTPVDSGGGGGGGSGAGLLLGGALAGALLLLRKPRTKLEKTLVLDSYGRTFQTDLSQQIVINDGVMHLENFFLAMDQKTTHSGFQLDNIRSEVAFAASTKMDRRFDMIEYFAMPHDVVINHEQADMSVATASKLGDNVLLTSGYRVSPKQAFGAVANVDSHTVFGRSSFISGQAFSSPLSGFSQQANTMSLSYAANKLDSKLSNKLGHKVSASLGLVSVDQTQQFGLDSFSSIIEGKYEFNDNAALSLQFGQIEEKGSLFGGAAGGLFGVNTATTYALNVAANIKATERFSVLANYGAGQTKVDASKNSLLSDFSNLRSDWYSFGVIGNNVFRGQDQIGFAVSQPLKIRSGFVDYSIPTGRDLSGLIAFDRERVNLSATDATERNIEAYYRTLLSDNLELGGFISNRQNPNHVSDYGDELLVMATLRFNH